MAELRVGMVNPEPIGDAVATLVAQLERLERGAARPGVTLCAETVPFGFMLLEGWGWAA